MSVLLSFERMESFVIFVVRLTFRVAAKVLFSFSSRTAKRSTNNTSNFNKEHKIHALIKHLREIERHEEELSVKLAIVRRQLCEEKMKNSNNGCGAVRSGKVEPRKCSASSSSSSSKQSVIE